MAHKQSDFERAHMGVAELHDKVDILATSHTDMHKKLDELLARVGGQAGQAKLAAPGASEDWCL